jgi:single-strand DNA-binding protein
MNKAILIGNLTRDPEASTTPNGINVCKFTIAVNRSYGQSDPSKQAVDYLTIVCWRALADTCSKFLKKGQKVCVCGAIQIRQYDTQDGQKRSITEIIAEEVQFLNYRSEDKDSFSNSNSNTTNTNQDKERSSPGIETLKPIEDGALPF